MTKKALLSESWITICGFLSMLLIVNYIGMEAKGLLFKIHHTAGLFSTIAFLGLGVTLNKSPENINNFLLLIVNLINISLILIYIFYFNGDNDLSSLIIVYSVYNTTLMLVSISFLAYSKLILYSVINSLISISFCFLVFFNYINSNFINLIFFQNFIFYIVLILFFLNLFSYQSISNKNRKSFLDTLKFLGSSINLLPFTLLSGAPIFYTVIRNNISIYDLGIISILLSFPNLIIKICRHIMISRLSKHYPDININISYLFLYFFAIIFGSYLSIFILFPISPLDYHLPIFLISIGGAILPKAAEIEGDLIRNSLYFTITNIKILTALIFILFFEFSSFIIGYSVLTFTLSLMICRVMNFLILLYFKKL